jgi:hypothetical protein
MGRARREHRHPLGTYPPVLPKGLIFEAAVIDPLRGVFRWPEIIVGTWWAAAFWRGAVSGRVGASVTKLAVW